MIKSRLKNKSVKLAKDKNNRSASRGRSMKIITGSTHMGEVPEVEEGGFHIVRVSKDRLRIRQRSIDRAIGIMKGFRDMRKNGIMLDFFIKVGDESFGVHRTIVAACSDYFQDVLEQMRDTKEKTFEMTDVDALSVKLCIDFMYSGKLSLEKGNLKGVMHAATIMQLTNLIRSCFSHIALLAEKPENCVEMAQLLQTFPNKVAKDAVKEHFKNKFERVVCTECFRNLSSDGVVDLLTNYSADDDHSLDGILEWINYRKDERTCFLEKLIDVMQFHEFPSDDVIWKISYHPIINSSKHCLRKLVLRMFSDILKLKINLRPTNCFILRQLAKSCLDIEEQSDSVILEYIGTHLDQTSTQTDFILLNEDDVFQVFKTSSGVEFLSTERFKWDAVFRWVTFDPERQDLLPRLLKTIHFNTISYSNSLMSSPLIQQSSECINIITQSFQTPRKKFDEHVAVLLPNEDLCLFEPINKTWHSLPKINDEKCLEIFSLNNTLCAVTENGLFVFRSESGWLSRSEVDADDVLAPETRISTTTDFIYLVDKKAVYYYSCLTDEWRCAQKGCGLENFAIAIVGPFIYAFGVDGAKKYNIDQQNWKEITNVNGINPGSSTVTMNNKIYVVGLDYQRVNVYDPSSDTWKNIKSLPVPAVTQTCAFVSRNRLYVLAKVSNRETLLMYDEPRDQWLVQTPVIPKNAKVYDESILSTFNFIPVRGFGPTSVKEQRGRSKERKAMMQSNPTGGLFVTPHNIVYESKPSPKYKLVTVMSACSFMAREGTLNLPSVVQPA